jgi:hypothetical protein
MSSAKDWTRSSNMGGDACKNVWSRGFCGNGEAFLPSAPYAGEAECSARIDVIGVNQLNMIRHFRAIERPEVVDSKRCNNSVSNALF